MAAQSRQGLVFTALLVAMIALTVGAAFSSAYDHLTPYIAFSAALLAAAMRRRGLTRSPWSDQR